MDRLREDMARMWNRMREDWNMDSPRPRTHLHQVDQGYVAEFELAGVNPDQVEIDVDAETVSVHGHMPPCPGESVRPSEGEFRVELSWPTEVNPDSAEAEWNHGLLSVKAHKAAAHRRRISLQAQH